MRCVFGGSDGEVYSEGSAQRPEAKLTESVLICRDSILSHCQHGSERACVSANSRVSVLSAAAQDIYSTACLSAGQQQLAPCSAVKGTPEEMFDRGMMERTLACVE